MFSIVKICSAMWLLSDQPDKVGLMRSHRENGSGLGIWSVVPGLVMVRVNSRGSSKSLRVSD
jgi:hypothetical protein